jgi:hypothetical protein
MNVKITFKSVKIVMWRESVQIVSVTSLIIGIIIHLWSVYQWVLCWHIEVIHRHGNIIMSVIPPITCFLKAIYKLEPSPSQESTLNFLSVIILHINLKLIWVNIILRSEVILLSVFEISALVKSPFKHRILCLLYEGSSHYISILFIFTLSIHYSKLRIFHYFNHDNLK